jgi:hypothetical protein
MRERGDISGENDALMGVFPRQGVHSKDEVTVFLGITILQDIKTRQRLA